MLRFALRRIGLAIITLLILVAIIFLLTRVFPSDPARQLAGPFAPQERVDAITEANGFDVRFQREDAPGYWEVRGYHNHADPWREERYG